MFFLVHYSGDYAAPIALEPGQKVTVGRDPEQCQIVLMDQRVSHKHFTLSAVGNKGWIEDLGSRNGTFVNRRRVRASLLSKGDVVRVGRCLIQVGESAESRLPQSRLEQLKQATWPGSRVEG